MALTTKAKCEVCRAPAPLQCSRCGFANYCSSTCQRKHWKREHQRNCIRKHGATGMSISLWCSAENTSEARLWFHQEYATYLEAGRAREASTPEVPAGILPCLRASAATKTHCSEAHHGVNTARLAGSTLDEWDFVSMVLVGLQSRVSFEWTVMPDIQSTCLHAINDKTGVVRTCFFDGRAKAYSQLRRARPSATQPFMTEPRTAHEHARAANGDPHLRRLVNATVHNTYASFVAQESSVVVSASQLVVQVTAPHIVHELQEVPLPPVLRSGNGRTSTEPPPKVFVTAPPARISIACGTYLLVASLQQCGNMSGATAAHLAAMDLTTQDALAAAVKNMSTRRGPPRRWKSHTTSVSPGLFRLHWDDDLDAATLVLPRQVLTAARALKLKGRPVVVPTPTGLLVTATSEERGLEAMFQVLVRAPASAYLDCPVVPLVLSQRWVAACDAAPTLHASAASASTATLANLSAWEPYQPPARPSSIIGWLMQLAQCTVAGRRAAVVYSRQAWRMRTAAADSYLAMVSNSALQKAAATPGFPSTVIIGTLTTLPKLVFVVNRRRLVSLAQTTCAVWPGMRMVVPRSDSVTMLNPDPAHDSLRFAWEAFEEVMGAIGVMEQLVNDDGSPVLPPCFACQIPLWELWDRAFITWGTSQ